MTEHIKKTATGIRGLDQVLNGGLPIDKMLSGGPYQGSATLVTGDAGAGKTSIAMSMIKAACARGEKCLVLLYEESAAQLERNMGGIGINLKQWTDSGMLKILRRRIRTRTW